jgi:hypothetical protein
MDKLLLVHAYFEFFRLVSDINDSSLLKIDVHEIFCLFSSTFSLMKKEQKIKSLIILQFTLLLKQDRFSDLYELLHGALISIRYVLSS